MLKLRDLLFLLAIFLGLFCEVTTGVFAQSKQQENDLFETRKKCQILAEHLPDAAEAGAYWRTTIISNFVVSSGHCYALIERGTQDTNTPAEKSKFHSYLYDAHTGELLASKSAEGINNRSGVIFDPYYEGSRSTFDDAFEYIKKLCLPNAKRLCHSN